MVFECESGEGSAALRIKSQLAFQLVESGGGKTTEFAETQRLAAFISRSYFSAPTHSLAKAHHSTQDVPMGREFSLPHFLQRESGSSDQISIFSPHCWHRISSGLGVRISALPGHPSLNMVYDTPAARHPVMMQIIGHFGAT